MIEKLDKDCGKLQKKINELIDTVNAILDYAPLEMAMKTEPADQFAEQRKWIGKLCKFWDDEDEEKSFSILEGINKNSPNPYRASGDWCYNHCEPVKQDDEAIYKGE